MRIFVSTGEASGDLVAGALAIAIRSIEPDATFIGIGSERMSEAGFALTTSTRGWASMGPLAAIARIPKLMAVAWRHALWLRAKPVDLIVLVDFGAFNLRFARLLRRLGYRRPILYFFPPGAWLDKPAQARTVARYTSPLTPFEHQRDFYRSLGLPVAYAGHPLLSLVPARAPHPVAAGDAGVIALLPGSREGEIKRHLPRLFQAARLIAAARPRATFAVAAADADSEARIRTILASEPNAAAIRIVRGSREAMESADAALVASGTAVLEAALREVPTVALYVLSERVYRIARRVYRRPYITLPNILLGRAVIPELIQDAATPEALARETLSLLADPAAQLAELRVVRSALGSPDALAGCADIAVTLARTA